MKTSFIATVFNEEKDIEDFIKSILTQSKKPDEIIIVDAFSSDRTLEILQKYKQLKLYRRKGNRSKGRNLAITKASGDVIIASDAGCVLDRDFIKKIIAPFNTNTTDIVSGYYYPITNSIFEKSLAAYTCTMPDKIDKKFFLPSSRSIAFRKRIWKSIGGYPEYLDTCEDLMFASKLRKAGHKFVFQKSAFVNWRQQSNIVSAFKQFFNYAKGDGQALYFRPTTPLIFIRYIIGIVLLFIAIRFENKYFLLFLEVGVLIYIAWSVKKNYKYVKSPLALIYLPVLQFASDIAVLFGMSFGFFTKNKI